MIEVLAAAVLLTLGGFAGVFAGRGLVWWDSYRWHTRDTLPSFDPPPPEAYRVHLNGRVETGGVRRP